MVHAVQFGSTLTPTMYCNLRAGPKHYFGYHESCYSEWCSEAASGHPKPINLDDLPPNFPFEVERAGDRVVNKAHQLINNKTTNLTECLSQFEQRWKIN